MRDINIRSAANRTLIFGFAVLLFIATAPGTVCAQTTEFTYHGQLLNASAPANGNFDFEFLLFDSLAGGAQVGGTLTKNSIAVANGIFAVKLDFGANFPGANRFLEIHVRQTGGGSFTPLTPRQAISSNPYSVKSLSADSATIANSATTAGSAANFTGVLAGDITGTQNATTLTKLRGIPLDTVTPTNGQVLTYDGPNNKWAPTTPSGSGTPTPGYVLSYSIDVLSIPVNVWDFVIFTNDVQLSGWTHTTPSPVFTCNQSGRYQISYYASTNWNLITSLATVTTRVTRNGVELLGSQAATVVSTNIPIAPVSQTVIANFNAGDTVRLEASCNAANRRILPAGTGDAPVAATLTIVQIN